MTTDMRTLDFQRALRQYGQLGLAMADTYAERALHTADTSERDKLEGVSEGLTILASALVDASSWDSPDRPRATNEDLIPTTFKEIA